MSKAEHAASAKVAKPPRESGNFVSKAHDMIEQCAESTPDVAGWNESGDTIVIHSSSQLEQDYLPKYFHHNNFQSFVRQLNLYGFRNVTKDMPSSTSVNGSNNTNGSSGSGVHAFRNPNFVRGRKDLVTSIQRSKTGDRAQRKTRQDEALRAISGELGGRLGAMETDVRDLHRKVDEVSSKLDLVIGMLSSAGIGAHHPGGGQMDMSMDGAAPRQQVPPPQYAAARSSAAMQNDTSSAAAINGWWDTVAGQRKRDRSGHSSSHKRYKSTRRADEEGKKVISSEGSLSGESDVEKNTETRRSNTNESKKHMFYDVDSGQHVESPLDDDRPDLFDGSCDDLELDPQTSSVLMTLNEDRSMEDPELGTRSLQIEGGSSGLSTEPIPFDAADIELPDIVLADDRPSAQSDGAELPRDQQPPGGMRKFVGRHRNVVLAGLMLTMIVAAAIGAGLSTQGRNASTPPPNIADTEIYTTQSDPPPQDMSFGDEETGMYGEEGGEMLEMDIMQTSPPPQETSGGEQYLDEAVASAPPPKETGGQYTAEAGDFDDTADAPSGGGGGNPSMVALVPDTAASSSEAEPETSSDREAPPQATADREAPPPTSATLSTKRGSSAPTAQPTAEPTFGITTSRLLSGLYPNPAPTPAPYFMSQHRYG